MKSNFWNGIYQEWVKVVTGTILAVLIGIASYIPIGQSHRWLPYMLFVIVWVFSWGWAFKRMWERQQSQLSMLQKDSEAFRNDVYGDVILGWMRKQCCTHCFFSTQFVAEKLGLPIETCLASIKFLRDRKFVRDGTKGSEWEFVPTDCLLATPYFVRNPILDPARQEASR